MSLRLRQTVAGRPSRHSRQSLACLTVDKQAVIAYTSSSNVVLLNEELDLSTTLAFWDSLPSRSSTSDSSKAVQGVIASGGLIIAWSAAHVVLWKPQQSRTGSSWVTHSSVLASEPVTSLDYQDGTLVLGTQAGIELWTLGQDRDVVFWDRAWTRSYPSPCSICVSPSKSHVAWHHEGLRSVHILGLDRKGQAVGIPQELRHPRDIDWIGWRKGTSSSGDAVLYTITTNTVFRVYSPVLDDPTWFQLLSTVDHRAFRPTPVSSNADPDRIKGKEKEKQDGSADSFGRIWPLDAEVLRAALLEELGEVNEGKRKPSAMVRKILEGLASEESDVLLYTDGRGYLAMRNIVNLDRKPPTLIKSLPVARIRLWDSHRSFMCSTASQLLHVPSSSTLLAISDSSDRIAGHCLSLCDLLASNPAGISTLSTDTHRDQSTHVQLTNSLDHFVRTPNGRGLLAIGETGEIGVWSKEQVGKPVKGKPILKSLAGKGQWKMPQAPLQSAIFAKGRAMVFYTRSSHDGPVISLQHLDNDASVPTTPIRLPHFALEDEDEVAMLLAVSDIDDGFSGRGRRTQRALVMAVSDNGQAWCWRITSRYTSTIHSEIDLNDNRPDIKLLHTYRLPIQGGQAPALVLPVDPMGWHQSVIDWKTDTPLQDMVLTISREGVLEYWQPRLGGLSDSNSDTNVNGHAHIQHSSGTDRSWTRSGFVETGRTAISRARCSSRKKTVLICDLPDDKQEATIWDSNVSEFSTGLELTYVFDEDARVQDLDWTTTSDLQSVLAVGFPHEVVLICEQRMSYSEKGPGWAPFITINLEKYTSVPINDSIWLAGGSLAVGAGNQIYLFSRFLDRGSPIPSPSASGRSISLDSEEPEDLFQLIAWQNGPLLDYHPTVLAQCLIWDKMDLVKRILVQLHRDLKECEDLGRRRLRFQRVDPFDFVAYKKQQKVASPKANARKYDGLFDAVPTISDEPDDDDEFNERIVQDLVKRLDGPVQIPLHTIERALLATIVEGTFEAEQQRRALDLCGLRYLVSVEQLASHVRRHDSPRTPSPDVSVVHKHRLSFRNIVWATHSESHDMLLTWATRYCSNGKMMWEDAKRLGVFLWLKSTETIKSQLEVIARNNFMAQEDRDPTGCSLIFFALGKKKVVHGLWRQAPGHKEQNMMLKFLGNDFTLDRWKTAALKNAYALLSKNRYEYAAAFFMLADQPKDAINICLRQLDDWQLAVALARAIEPDTSGPLLKWILDDTVIPLAFEGGHRWLASWAFWLVGKRDLSVRVLISPMSTVAHAWSPTIQMAVGLSENDDPSLLLLFQYLKSKSLQTAKGTSEIPSKLEFDFVLHNARVFFRMGCHALALDLLRNWSFDRPFFPPAKVDTQAANKRPQYSPVRQRRPSFMLANGHGRRESMVMDMDVLAESESVPVSRAASPPPAPPVTQSNGAIEEAEEEEGQAKASATKEPEPVEQSPPKKMGNLMKELKQDVTQGAMEFNMDSFF